MPLHNKIKYLERKDIDDSRWNECIAQSPNGLIYAYSFYLDHMADNWDALVLGDYEAVMPLPWRKKWGITYLYHPFLMAQLGVFGKGMTAVRFAAFLQTVPKKFRYWDLPLNHQNLFPVDNFPIYQRNNFVLTLNSSYEKLYAAYRNNIKRNIKKSRDYGCSVVTDVDLSAIIELTNFQPVKAPENDLQHFNELYRFLKEKKMAKTYGIINQQGELLASCVFVFSHKRAYYILVGNHPNGRTLGASHALIDAFIKDHSGQDLLLDFEGSDIRNLAFFYSSFGAVEEKYAAIQLNRLPWWMKWLKK